jgi:hypothetical protein
MKKTLTMIGLLSCLAACGQISPTLTSVATLTESQASPSLYSGLVRTDTPVGWDTTSSPQATPVTKEVIYLPFSTTDWTLWFEYDASPHGLTIDSQGTMWAIVRDKVAYFDGQGWIPVSPDEIDLTDIRQLSVAGDGTVWVLGIKVQEGFLAHYDGRNWAEFALPETISTNQLVTMAIDSTDQVWISAKECYTDQCLFSFSDDIWQEKQLPVHDVILGGADVLSDSEGDIWVCGGGFEGIAELRNNDWHYYLGSDLWPERPFVGFRSAEQISIRAGMDGSIWAYLESTSWVIHLQKDGSIERLPIGLGVDTQNLSGIIIQENRGNLFWVGIDRRSSLMRQLSPNLGFFDGMQWVSFTDLPFQLIYSIDETPDGIILVLTENGLYRYEPQ